MNINLQTRNNFKAGFTGQHSDFKYVNKAEVILPPQTGNNIILGLYGNNKKEGSAGAAKTVRPRIPNPPNLQGGDFAQEKEPFAVKPKQVTPIVVQAGKTFIG